MLICLVIVLVVVVEVCAEGYMSISCAPDITVDRMKAAPDSGRNLKEFLW